MSRYSTVDHNGSFISPLAEIGDGVRLGTSVKIYGRVRVGDRTWIDSGVTLGYPQATDIAAARQAGDDEFLELDDALHSAANNETVIGADSLVRSGSVIYDGVYTGPRLDCAHHVIVREQCVLGSNVELGPLAYLKRDCRVGDRSRIAAEICDRTVVGRCCTVYGRTAHEFKSGVSGVIEDAPILADGVVIGREAVVIGPVHIGQLALVGAGAMVTGSVDPEMVVVGNPARNLRPRSQEEAPELWRRVKNEALSE